MGDDLTWMSVLRESGYRCVSVGKTHMIHAGSFHIQVPVARTFGDQGGWNHFHPCASPEPEETYFDIHATRRACQALRRLKETGPFALFLGFHAPHEPYVMPERYLSFLSPEDVPLPTARAPDEYQTKSDSYRRRVELFRTRFGGIDDEMTRVGIAGYHCLLKMVDDCLGMLLEELRSLDLLEDTLIVYMSDHGDLLGEHGLFNKAATYYEGEVRIPLMFRFPDQRLAGHSVPHFGAGVDIFPTLLDYLGVPADISLPGVSLRPAIEEGRPVRDHVSCATARSMMIRTRDHKLWYNCDDKDGEMYDLRSDPQELRNLYGMADDRELRRELFELMLHSRMSDDMRYCMPTERDLRLHDEVHASYEPEVPPSTRR
jgi:arylsulfatase A-like enzyme